MKVCLNFVLLLLLLQATGCGGIDIPSYPMNEYDILGRYDAKFGDAKIHFFVINDDSTYIKYYMGHDNIFYQDTGRWTFTPKKGNFYTLCLYDLTPRFEESRDIVWSIKQRESMNLDTSVRVGSIKKYTTGIGFGYCRQAQQFYWKSFEKKE
ncbi:MAG: hypothetical protein KAR42_03905 [candidate division Zixibacteria bacterium]|nr:hypothetical protein [candidate division Zixibacteria bacterium]